MSLRVWLPLINDTHNQGLLNLPTPWDARSRDTGGKLGQYCYSDNAIYHIENEWLGNIWSLACWVKSSGWSQYNDIILCKNISGSDSAQFYLSIIGGTQLNIGCNAGSQTLTISNTFATNTWYHIAATYDGSTLKLYLNGNEVGTKAYVSTQKTGMNNLGIGCRSTNTAGTSATGGGNKRTNDIRIYDHCLSPLEVKEISQGLILHYPLNGINDNLIPNSKISFGTTKEWTGQGWASTCINHNNLVSILQPSTQYTFSWDAEVIEHTTVPTNYDIHIGFLFYSSSTSSANVSSYQGGMQTVGKKCHVKTTFTTPATIPNDYILIFYTNRYTTNGGNPIGFDTIKYSNIKLELGPAETAYCFSNLDSGKNINIIQDCSGYGNDGTLLGSSVFSSDTNRYNSSIYLDGNAQCVQMPNLSTILTDTTYTMNVWFKKVTGEWSTKAWETIFGGPSGFELELKNGSSNSPVLYAYSWNKGNTTYTLDEWHMLTMVRTSSGTTFYLDGIQAFTGTAGSIPSGNYFIGSWRDSTSQNMKGYVSDFRLYSTALSEADIKALYNTSANVDNLGNFHSFEFVEDDRKSIDKNGIAHASDIVEYKLLERLKYDKTIYKEPDGSSWIRVAHHNNPTTSGYFNRTDDWDNGVYLSADKWYNMDAIESVSTWEFMVKQKTTSSATETKYRWVQYKSPFTAVWADVKPGTVTFNTSTGYSSSSYGGLWQMNNYARLCIANGSSSNWFGAFGCWTTYNTNNIPGYPNTNISTGYMDLYVRVPDANIKDDGTFTANEFIEK